MRINILHPRTLERSPGSGEALKLTEKLSAFLTGEGDECSPGIVQSRPGASVSVIAVGKFST